MGSPPLFAAVVFVSLLAPSGISFSQNQPTPRQSVQSPGSNTLRICLRLPDESLFAGFARVHLVTVEGNELSATTEADGEFAFADVPSADYTLEANAPGFLTSRQQFHIEAGQIQTRFVIMKPDIVPQPSSEEFAATTQKTNSQAGYWHPPDLDEVVPLVQPQVECPVSPILKGVGQRMQELVENLERFTALEQVEHLKIDSLGSLRPPETRRFDYVVMISRGSAGGFVLDEYRNGSMDPEQFPAHIATQGLTAMALVFHPVLIPDYNFTCEGLGQWQGSPAWQVHFVQRQDRPRRLLAYSAGGKHSNVALKGRAWIDPGSLQVLRLESALAQPIPDLGLTEYHVAITYEPIRFRTREQHLWLPKEAQLFVERGNRRYYRRHSFSAFQLFSVDTLQSIQLDKESYGFTNRSDHDITGVLTVTPIHGAELGVVTLTLTIPAGGSVSKSVGRGKDVSLPIESVGSATFVHAGPPGSIQVDARLSKESTLDVVSGAAASLQP